MANARMLLVAALVACGSAQAAAGQATARETTVQIRVLSRDAKLMGDAVGGVRVTVTDAGTGRVLASGVTGGGTGDTEAIMTRRRQRGAGVFDTPGAAGWLARFHLARPTRVEITAEGPLGYPDAKVRASKTMLLAPGAEIRGDGVMLELNGFIVEILEPDGPRGGAVVPVRARVRMLCSCPTQPGGRWSVDRVSARLLDGDAVVAETILDFAGEPSVYAGTLRAPGPGAYTLEVLAADPATGNFGRTSGPVEVPAGG